MLVRRWQAWKKRSIAVFYFDLYFYAIHVNSDHVSVNENPSYNYTWPQLEAAWCSTSTFSGKKSIMFILVKNEKSLLNCALFFLIVFTSSFHTGFYLFSSCLPSLNKMEVSWDRYFGYFHFCWEIMINPHYLHIVWILNFYNEIMEIMNGSVNN